MKILAKEELKITRIKKGFSVTKLASCLNITRQAVSQLESRKNGVTPETAKTITVALDVKFDDIFEIVGR